MSADSAVAALEELPASLRPRMAEPPRPTLNPASPPPVACWQPGQRESWRSLLPAASWEEVAGTLGLSEAARCYVTEGTGDPAVASAGIERPHGPRIGVWRSKPWLDLLLGLGPAAIARLFGLGGGNWRATPEALRGFVAAHEFEVARIARSFPPSLVDELLAALVPIADVRIADLAARRHSQIGAGPASGAAALGWLLANAEHAAWALAATALTDGGGKAKAARLGLQELSARGHGAAVGAAARAFGVVPDALRVEPETAALPRFWNPARIAAPLLANGKQLPTEAVEVFVKLLASDDLAADEQLARLDPVLSRDSLERFGLDLFHAAIWRPKSRTTELWPKVLGRYGGDAVVEELAAKVTHEWEDDETMPKVSCEVLRRIGTPRAIAELARLAGRRRSQVGIDHVQDAAEASLASLALARAMHPRALVGDAIAPLGRGVSQPRTLSFGPRAFRVELDAQLSLALFDEEGARIAQLPRPRKSDDDEAVTRSKEQLQQLRDQLALVAPVVLAQLEDDLVHDRRWPRVQLEAWLAGDEVFRHVAKHLVWALWSDQGELLSPAFVEDGRLRPTTHDAARPDRVGLLHPADVSAEMLASLRETTAARGLQPPFAQVDREVYRPSPEETQAESVERFSGARLRLRRPLVRGWRQGPIDDDTAHIDWYQRRFECGVTAELLHSGIDCGDAPPSSLKLGGLRFRGTAGLLVLAEVPARCLSEAVRDAAELASGG